MLTIALMALRPKSNLTTLAYCMSTLAKLCTEQIRFESSWAFLNPEEKSKISEMKTASGTTIDTERNKFFKSIGSSVRPAYPGLRVIKTAAVNFRGFLS